MRNFKNFRKVATDERSTTFSHSNGSKLIIPHDKLDKNTLQSLQALPLHRANGGDAETEGAPAQEDDFAHKIGRLAKDAAGSVVKQIMAPLNLAGQAASALGIPTPGEAIQGLGQGLSDVGNFSSGVAEGAGLTLPPPAPPSPTAEVPTNVNLTPAQPAPAAIDQSALMGLNSKYDMTEGFNTQMSGIKAEAKAIGDLEKQKAAQMQEHQQMMTDLNAQTQQHAWNNKVDLDNAIEDMKNSHIDPKAYINNMTTNQKVGTAIGLILGGMGGGIMGTGQNVALDFLNKQIANDVEAQVKNRDNKQTVYNAMLHKFQDEKDAAEMTRAFYISKMQNDLSLAAAKAGTPIAQARAQQALGPLLQQKNQILLDVARKQAVFGMLQNPTGNMDPAILVRHVVPQEHQKQVFDEIKDAQNTHAISKKILDAFDRGSSRNPVASAQGRREFEGLINTTVTDLEGTAREAAFNSIHNNMSPSGTSALPGENEARRRTVENYLASKMSAPTAKGYGIDLTKFLSTQHNNAGNGFKKR